MSWWSRTVLKVKTTSLAVNGVPSFHSMPLRSLMVSSVKSALYCQVLGEPVLVLAGEHVEHDQRLGHGLQRASVPAVLGRGHPDIEVVEGRVLTVGAALDDDQRPFTRARRLGGLG